MVTLGNTAGYPIGNLINAVSDIDRITAERRARKPEYPEIVNDKYRAMFKKMGAVRGRYVKGLGFCLEPEEKALLAQYLFKEADDSEKSTLSAVLMEDLDTETAKGLYAQCILHFDDMGYKPMFETLRTNAAFAGIVEKEYGYKPDGAFGAMLEGRAPEYFNGVAAMKASGGAEGYFGALEKLGVPRGCRLFEGCASLYILVCDAKEYKRIGAAELLNVTQEWNQDLKRRLLENMLAKLDEYQLRGFVSMLDMFVKITGPEGSASYNQVLAGVSGNNKRKYNHWLGQNMIISTFGQGERADFWLDYVDRMRLTKHGPSGALIFDFGEIKIIEFKNDIPAYFYDTEYFERVVADGLSTSSSEKELDAWLEKNTDWARKDGEVKSDQTVKHWRKAHMGNWKNDVRDYIGNRSVG